MLLALLLAGLLRFWQLGEIPPGFYRDEAFNGLDAAAVLAGERTDENPFYFEANNGREPAYIYLTALAVAFFGQTVTAVRITAALIGTLTTLLVYLLGKSWFDNRVGLLAAFLWAITVWSVHLSRVGLRPVLMPFMMALVFWLGTLAYRRSAAGKTAVRLWLSAGLIYGLAFYTYLAVRFTPVLLGLILAYVWLRGTRRRGDKALTAGAAEKGVLWFVAGAVLVVLPLAALFWQRPEIIFGRAGQVSILNPAVSGDSNLFAVLWRHSWQALGMFLVEGDTIVRHNPPGRPVFDLLIAAPFLVGVFWCLRNWRRPAAAALILWALVMLGPTILAEDTPHFLRAVGLLPAIMFFPALGLERLWQCGRLPPVVGPVLVILLLLGSLGLSVHDYFVNYGRDPETAYWFEFAARKLAENINTYEVSQTGPYLDQRFWDGWPAVRFLVHPDRQPAFFRPETVEPGQFGPAAVVYAWPYEGLEQVLNGFEPGLVRAGSGELAQGDLEPAPYPFYSRYTIEPAPDWPVLAKFDNSIQLRQSSVIVLADHQGLKVDLYWSTTETFDVPLVVFVHVVGPDGSIIAQSDSVPALGNWPSQWWRPGLILHDPHILDSAAGLDPAQTQIVVGLYHAGTKVRLAVYNADGTPAGDTWLLNP